MITKTNLESVYIPSQDVVAREIEGVVLIVPIISGIGDMEDELFTLNETGKVIWKMLNGQRTLKEIAATLAVEYASPLEDVQEDVAGLASELLKRRMIVEAHIG